MRKDPLRTGVALVAVLATALLANSASADNLPQRAGAVSAIPAKSYGPDFSLPKRRTDSTDPGAEGGFKRSSQHFGKGGCDEYSKATFGPVRAGAIAVTWSAAGGGTCRPAAVLVCDRGR